MSGSFSKTFYSLFFMPAASRSVDSYSSPFSSVHRFLILTFGDTRSSGLPSFVPSFGTVFQRFPFSLFTNQKIIRRSFRTRTGLFFFYWLSMFLFCCFIFLCSEVLNVVGIVEVSVGLCFFLFFFLPNFLASYCDWSGEFTLCEPSAAGCCFLG